VKHILKDGSSQTLGRNKEHKLIKCNLQKKEPKSWSNKQCKSVSTKNGFSVKGQCFSAAKQSSNYFHKSQDENITNLQYIKRMLFAIPIKKKRNALVSYSQVPMMLFH
jgi:hypothetical protein